MHTPPGTDRVLLLDDIWLPFTGVALGEAISALPQGARRVSGPECATRLDRLGHTGTRADHALAEQLRLTTAAMEQLSLRVRGRLRWLLEQAVHSDTLDSATWRYLFSRLRQDDDTEWLLFLAAECPPLLLIRNCLLARPDAELWLASRDRVPLSRPDAPPPMTAAAAAGRAVARAAWTPEPG